MLIQRFLPSRRLLAGRTSLRRRSHERWRRFTLNLQVYHNHEQRGLQILQKGILKHAMLFWPMKVIHRVFQKLLKAMSNKDGWMLYRRKWNHFTRTLFGS